MAKTVVTSRQQVLENIAVYHRAVASAAGLQNRIGRHKSWYAAKGAGGNWVFGPSKFIGYAGNDAATYLETYDRMDGRESEAILREWFAPVMPQSDLGMELKASFQQFAAGFGKRPNESWRVSIAIEMPATSGSQSDEAARLMSRVVSDPAICGGRPCIRGTRMRASDIVDMIGHGASESEILADFPYIAAEDIRAALLYAARAMDHDVVRAA